MKFVPVLLVGFLLIVALNRKRVMSNLSHIRLSKNFVLSEFVRTQTGLENVPNEQEIQNIRELTVDVLQPLRDYLARPVVINSGFRSQAVNENVGGSETSQHRTGEAADITVEGVTNEEIINAIVFLNLPFDQLIDEFTKSKLSGKVTKWVHVSRSGSRQRNQILSARWDEYQNKTIYSPYQA